MEAWFSAKAEASNKRHEKLDGEDYVVRPAVVFHRLGVSESTMVDLSQAIISGAVSVSRGKKRKSRDCDKSNTPPPKRIPAARVMLKNLKGS
jgi:hypothetical protein